jgi:hypothetical protein
MDEIGIRSSNAATRLIAYPDNCIINVRSRSVHRDRRGGGWLRNVALPHQKYDSQLPMDMRASLMMNLQIQLH